MDSADDIFYDEILAARDRMQILELGKRRFHICKTAEGERAVIVLLARHLFDDARTFAAEALVSAHDEDGNVAHIRGVCRKQL